MVIRNRYPGYHVLDQQRHWDEATRRLVMNRVHSVPPFRHLNVHQRNTLEALCARVIPQEHRPVDQRVPIAPWIDQSLDKSVMGGFRYEDMPAHSTAWEWGLEGLDETAESLFGVQFVKLDGREQDKVLNSVREGNPPGDVWQRMPARRWWTTVAVRQIASIYYAHPYAWDEIGFGGPAYPRGYFALNHGAAEPWEVQEAPPSEGSASL